MLFPKVGDLFQIIYGRELLPVLTADLDDYLVVADGFVYEKYKDQLKNHHDAYIVKNVETSTLEEDVRPYKDKKVVVAMGGGMAIDAGKWIAEHIQAKIHSVPTVLSVNAAFCYKSAIRINNVVTYMGRIFPEAIYIDFDIIQAAPKHLNISGAADLMACLTASYDWKLNSMVTKSHKFSQEIYDGSQYLLGMLAENIDNIREVNDDGIYFMCEAFHWVAEHSAIMNHTMWESASEHALFDTMEYVCQKGFLHGQIIGLTTYFMSLFQDNQHERAVSMLKRLGIDITLKGLDITEEQLRTGLRTAKDFTISHGMRYTILQAKPMTEEWINMAIDKYKKDFHIDEE
ncbi:MAG: iron-containing alcohol dehydrogenase [Blautia sp.]